MYKIKTIAKNIVRHVKHAEIVATEHAAKEERYWQAARRILPISLTEQTEFIRLDDGTYITCVVVGVPTHATPGYPSTISPDLIGSLLNTAQEHCAIGYSFAMRPFSQRGANSAMEDVEFRNIADQMADAGSNKLGHVRNRTLFVAEDIAADQKKVYRQDVTMDHTSCIITIRADTLDELYIARSHVKTIIKNNMVGRISPNSQMRAAYHAAQPYGNPWADKTAFAVVDAQSPQVAAMLPVRNIGAKSDDDGIWFGTHATTGAELIYDVDALATQHGFILGPSGSGKTTVETILGMRFKDSQHYRVVYLTMKADAGTQFRAPPAYYKDAGGIIDIGSGEGKTIFNPLQLIHDTTFVQSTEEYLRTYHDHKANAIAFFDAFIKEGISGPQKNYLDTTLNEIFVEYGIISIEHGHIITHPGKWIDGDNFPLLKDLRKRWKVDIDSGKLKLVQLSAESLYNNTSSLDTLGAYAYLNAKTTADFSKDYIVIDLSGLKRDLQDAMSVLVTGIVSIRFRTDAKRQTLLVIDEGVAFMRNPERMNFVNDASMMGRSLRVALMICFTQTADLTPELASMLKTNSMWSIILGYGMGVADAKYAQDFFHIPDEYMGYLTKNVGAGDGLFMIRDQIIPMHFTVTDQELDILKGTYDASKKASADGAFEVMNQVTDLVLENGFCMDEWIQDTDADTMGALQYKAILVQSAFGNGKRKAWVQSDIIEKDAATGKEKIYNQSIDHYATVIQLAGYLAIAGFTDVVVSHFDSADVTARCGDLLCVFEYERPGSHTKKQIKEKQIAAEKLESTNSRCFFVCQKSHESFIADAVGIANTYTRGAVLKAAVDAVIAPAVAGGDVQ